MPLESRHCACGLALDGRAGHAYNEEAFRHLLAIERRRATRSQRACLLLLVSLRSGSARAERMPPDSVTAIFTGLSVALRDVDFVGWFRQERVAAAFLAQGAELPADAPLVVGERVTDTLRRSLTAADAARLQVRVLRLRPRRHV